MDALEAEYKLLKEIQAEKDPVTRRDKKKRLNKMLQAELDKKHHLEKAEQITIGLTTGEI